MLRKPRPLKYFDEFPWLWSCLNYYIKGITNISKTIISKERFSILEVPEPPAQIWFYIDVRIHTGVGDVFLFAPVCIKKCHAGKKVYTLFKKEFAEIFNIKSIDYNNHYIKFLEPPMVKAICVVNFGGTPHKQRENFYVWQSVEILLPSRLNKQGNFSTLCSDLGI